MLIRSIWTLLIAITDKILFRKKERRCNVEV